MRLAKEDAERKKMQDTMDELEKTMNELSAEEDAQQSSQSASPIALQQTVKSQPPLSTHTPVCSPVMSEGNPILRPIPIKHQVVSSQMNNNKPISAFNLSDFEADTSSPFDNMELKTINDLEELAQVLQPVAGSNATSQMPGYYQSTGSSDESFVNVHRQTMNSQVSATGQPYNFSSSNKMLNDTKCSANYQSHVNGFTSNYDYNSMQGYHPQSVIPNLIPHGQVAAYNYPETELLPQSSDLSFSYPHQDTQRHLQTFYSSNVWPSVPYNQTRPTLSSYATILGKEGNAVSSDVPVFNVVPSSTHLNRIEDRSPEVDVEPSVSAMAQQLGDLMKSRATRNNPKPLEGSTPESGSSVQSPTSPTEPDLFESLNTESKQLVQKITEMGFPRVRVARACVKFGSNDKKIVEFLLTLQSLLEAGYQEGRAENALSLHNQDINSAIKFLQVESQLLDLGFPEDRVSEALMKFNCDRDQALEFLIS